MTAVNTPERPAKPDVAVTDGRSMRKVIGGAKMVEAALKLIDEGQWHLTAKAVADGSGMSIRSFFAYYGSVDGFVEHLIANHRDSLVEAFIQQWKPDDTYGGALNFDPKLLRVAMLGRF